MLDKRLFSITSWIFNGLALSAFPLRGGGGEEKVLRRAFVARVVVT